MVINIIKDFRLKADYHNITVAGLIITITIVVVVVRGWFLFINH